MEMTTTQRVDVARQVFAGIPLHEAISLARRYAGSENKLRPRLSQTLESLAEALPALLQQLADAMNAVNGLTEELESAESKLSERDAEIEQLRDGFAEAGRYAEMAATYKLRYEAAERAREGATSLLYEADAYLCTARIAAETRDRIAAFLAANNQPTGETK